MRRYAGLVLVAASVQCGLLLLLTGRLATVVDFHSSSLGNSALTWAVLELEWAPLLALLAAACAGLLLWLGPAPAGNTPELGLILRSLREVVAPVASGIQRACAARRVPSPLQNGEHPRAARSPVWPLAPSTALSGSKSAALRAGGETACTPRRDPLHSRRRNVA